MRVSLNASILSVAAMAAAPTAAWAQSGAAPPELVPIATAPVGAQPVALPAAQGPGIPARIESDGPVTVAIQSPSGEVPVCTAPCTVNVPEYPVVLVTSGDGYPRVAHPLQVVSPTRYRLHRPSGGGVAGGVILITLGSAAALVGLGALLLGVISLAGTEPSPTPWLISLGCLGGGGALIAGGAVLLRGSQRRDLEPVGPLASITPAATLVHGGATFGLRLAF